MPALCKAAHRSEWGSAAGRRRLPRAHGRCVYEGRRYEAYTMLGPRWKSGAGKHYAAMGIALPECVHPKDEAWHQKPLGGHRYLRLLGACTDQPKSAIFSSPRMPRSRFSGLMSRWMTCLE